MAFGNIDCATELESNGSLSGLSLKQSLDVAAELICNLDQAA